MNGSDPLESSDSSDEDYIPDTKSEKVSETDSDGKPDSLSSSEETETHTKKRTKRNVKSRKKQKKIEDKEAEESCDRKQLSEDDKKRIEEDVWADFMRDTGFKSRNERLANVDSNKPTSETSDNYKLKPTERKTETIKVSQVYKFAGENVTVEKEIPKTSGGDILLVSSQKTTHNDKNKRKSNSSGISGILNQLGKKSKITTLEKSKLDWDRFKKEENLEEELQTYNRGKDGYLERQDFLERADLRRFEIEKEIRTVERNKRVNQSSL